MTYISKVFWKRTYLFVEVCSNSIPRITLKNAAREVEFEVKQLDESLYRGKLNLCIADGRGMLASGTWNIMLDDVEEIAICDVVLENIESLSNVYRYDGDKAYITTFHLDDKSNGNFEFKLKVDYMMKNPHPERRIDKLFLLKKTLNFVYKVARGFTPKRGNKILLMSENHEKMTGNLKSLYERMLERGLDSSYQIDLSFRNVFASRQNPLDWFKTVIKIASHDYIFVDDYVPIFGFLELDSKTTLVQTWHAGFGFKSVGYGRFGLEGSPNPYHSCHRKYTYGLVGNEYLREIYSEVWGIEKESLLATGMPRLSGFLDSEKIANTVQKLYQEMPKLKGKKIITFAPTYRGSNQKEAYYDMSKVDQDVLAEYCKTNNAVVLMKFHPFLQGKRLVDERYKDFLIDVSNYNLNDLFYITDVLITDYSSCFYDYILLNKPVLFYVYDEIAYAATRGVHRPVSKVAPGKICRTFEELINALRDEDYTEVSIPKFMIDKCSTDKEMTASDKVIDYIILGKKDINI